MRRMGYPQGPKPKYAKPGQVAMYIFLPEGFPAEEIDEFQKAAVALSEVWKKRGKEVVQKELQDWVLEDPVA